MSHIGKFKAAKTIGFFLLLTSHLAWADVLPGPALPEQISKSLTSRHAKPIQPAQPGLRTPEEKPSPLAEAAKKITFQLNEIILEGNHIYSSQLLQSLYQNKLHTKISVAELFAITQSITNFYRNNGYIISQALLPPQHIKNGVVHIKIIEGFIDKASVIGNPHGAKNRVAIYGEKIRQNPPLQISRLQKYLLLANEIPGTQVQAVLSPSKAAVGGSDIALVTNNKPVTGYVSYDNYGTLYNGPQEGTANLGFNSIIASGDTTQLTYVKTPKGGELTYIDANYSLPITNEGTRWLAGRTSADTHPLFALEPANVYGLNTNYYTNLQIPVVRTPTQNLSFQFGFIYASTISTTLGQTLYVDHIRSLALDGIYNFADRFYGSNSITGTLKKGLPIFGYSTQTDPATALTSRPGGFANYFKIVMQLSRLQHLQGPVSVYGLFRAQKAFNPVLAAEQFSFGGSQLGRGYDVAELLGDKGIGGTIELRFDLNFGKLLLNSLQLYGFYDAGEIWNYHNASNTQTKQGATSTGFGSRIFFNQYVSGNVMWTQPLTKYVAAEQLIGQGRRPRVFFSIVAAYS